jgi:hypothetical protein
MVKGWDDLAVQGDAVSVGDADLDAWTARTQRPIPTVVRDALKKLGPGKLYGIFEVPAPSERWKQWHVRADALRARGLWAGLDEVSWKQLFVFAADERGDFLAVGLHESFWILAADGGAVEIGRGVCEMLDALEKFVAGMFPAWREGELGIERNWVRGEPLREWLQLLEAGEEGDALEKALSAEPLLVAYTHALHALAGPDADAIPLPQRVDAADTLLYLMRRRQPSLLSIAVPHELAEGEQITHPVVRAWGSGLTRLDARPPLETEMDRYPIVEPLDEELRGKASFAWVDAAQSIASWVSTWDAPSEREVAKVIQARCSATAASSRFAVTRLLGHLQHMPAHGGLMVNGAMLSGWPGESDARDIAERLARRRKHAWPFVLLALRPLPHWVSGLLLPVLGGVREPEVAASLLGLVERPNFVLQGHQYAFQGEKQFYASQYADAYVETFTPDDAVIGRFLPWLDRPNSTTGMLEMGPVTLLAARPTDDRIYDALLTRFAQCPGVIAKAITKRPTPRGVAVLKQHMRSKTLQTRFEVAHALVAIGDPEGPAALERCRAADERI